MDRRPPTDADARAHTVRDRLMVLLALGTGATDAVTFERFGHTFASVMTGNLVLLGVGAARAADAGAAARPVLLAGVALIAYGLGVLLTSPRRREATQAGPRPAWPHATTVVLGLDLTLLVAVSVGWELADGRPGRVAQTLLIAGATGAMGARGSATRRLDGISTTYLTSTFISLLEAIAARTWTAGKRRGLAIVVAAVLGAGAATLLVLHAPRLVPILLLAPPALVVAQATWLPRASRLVRSSVSR